MPGWRMASGTHARLRPVALLVVLAIAVAACGTGTEAVAVGDTFRFVAPGGHTRISYDPPGQRGVVQGLSGESLLDPGRRIGLDEFAGQVVVLNVWGSWCGPCREEAPGLQQVYEETTASGVTVPGSDVRDDCPAATDFVRDRGLTYPSLSDPPGRSLLALRDLPRNTVPLTIVLDRIHRVAAVFLTALRVSELMSVVQRVAAEPIEGGPA